MTESYPNPNREYPTLDQLSDKLPRSLQFVIFTNYFFAINAWSIFLYMFIVLAILQATINLIYIFLMLIPSLVLSALSSIVSINLMRRSNIMLSSFHVIMDLLLLDMLNVGPISSSIGSGLNVDELYSFVMSLLLLSIVLSCGSLFLLIFNRSLESYYLNKGIFRKPWFIRNFAGTSIIASIPFALIYITFFNLSL